MRQTKTPLIAASRAMPSNFRPRLTPVEWCPRRDSNPHTSRHMDLNHARLPIPPRGHCFNLHGIAAEAEIIAEPLQKSKRRRRNSRAQYVRRIVVSSVTLRVTRCQSTSIHGTRTENQFEAAYPY